MKAMPLTPPPGKAGFQKTAALLGAFCLFLSTIEYLIPKPLPFARIGLANLPLILAVDIFPFPSFLVLVSLKALGQALVTGTLFSYVFLFSLAGTAASALAMYGLRRLLGKKLIGFTGLSVVGALLSNGIQLVLARFFVFGAAVRYIAPPFLAMGLITAFALGVFCEYFAARSRWYAACTGRAPAAPAEQAAPPAERMEPGEKSLKWGERFRLKRERAWEKLFSSRDLATAGLLAMPALLFNPDTKTRVIQFLFFFFLVWLAGKKTRPLITLFTLFGIVAFNLLAPYGELLFSLGSIKISAGALLSGVRRAVTLEGLFMLSRAAVRQDLKLPGGFGALAGESLRLFAGIRERKNWFRKKDLVAGIDRLLMEADAGSPKENRAEAEAFASKTTPGGFIILAAVIIAAWLLWLF
jgi:heptaprenyl diphosphate synthase